MDGSGLTEKEKQKRQKNNRALVWSRGLPTRQAHLLER